MLVPPSLSSQRLCTTLQGAPTAPGQAPGMKPQPMLQLKVRTSALSGACLGVTLAWGDTGDTVTEPRTVG